MIDILTSAGDLTGRIIVLLDLDVVLIQGDELTAVTADGQAGVRLHEAVDGDGAFPTSCDGIDSKLGTSVNITANEDVGFCGLIGKAVCDCAITATQFYTASLQQVTPQDTLTDRQEYSVRASCGVTC